MRISAADLDRRITILRAASIDDGTATVAGDLAPIGKRWAKKTDVSDGERMRAAQQGQTLTSRFLVRADRLTKTIAGTDVILCGGVRYEVVGAKEWGGRNNGIEITTNSQSERLP